MPSKQSWKLPARARKNKSCSSSYQSMVRWSPTDAPVTKKQAPQPFILQNRHHLRQVVQKSVVAGQKRGAWRKFPSILAPGPHLFGRNHRVFFFEQAQLLAENIGGNQAAVESRINRLVPSRKNAVIGDDRKSRARTPSENIPTRPDTDKPLASGLELQISRCFICSVKAGPRFSISLDSVPTARRLPEVPISPQPIPSSAEFRARCRGWHAGPELPADDAYAIRIPDESSAHSQR